MTLLSNIRNNRTLLIISMIGGVFVVFGLSILVDRLTDATPTVATTTTISESRLVYDDLYQLNWRVTTESGNVSVEATYFSPSLRAALAAIDQPSQHQQAMQRQLTDIPPDAVVYYVIFAQPNAFLGTVEAPATVVYAGSEHELTWSELDPLLLPQTDYAQRDGFYWAPSTEQPTEARVHIVYPTDTTHTFAWNNLIDQ